MSVFSLIKFMAEKIVICRDKDDNQKEVNVSELVFRPAVYGILIENNKVLLSKQWGGYDFPGGGMKIHETIYEALKREFFEETGFKIQVGELLACEHNFYVYTTQPHPPTNCILIYFICRKISGELSTENFDEYEKQYAEMAEWIPLKKIKEIKFHNGVDSVKIIDKAQKLLNNK